MKRQLLPATEDWQQWFMAYLLEKSYLGMWTEDVLATARRLRTYETTGDVRNREGIKWAAAGKTESKPVK